MKCEVCGEEQMGTTYDEDSNVSYKYCINTQCGVAFSYVSALDKYKDNFNMAYTMALLKFTREEDVANRRASLYAIKVDSNTYYGLKFNDDLFNEICKDLLQSPNQRS